MRNNLLLSLHGRTFRTEPCPEGDRTLRARTYCWLQQGHQLPMHRIAGEAMPLECVAGPKMSQAAVLEEPLLTEGDAAGTVDDYHAAGLRARFCEGGDGLRGRPGRGAPGGTVDDIPAGAI
ncbi:unnamed protein product [Polarella glacialis]|uniref:Uncharacterized protein n=1 Tax=Polarella glacialis TaxID=89957 RepID=A0A813M0Q7_POLGL|nr:unnamed protein product [Polarella glacialis]CAE8737624.1 unnamed protein product [Polarella glacialis]